MQITRRYDFAVSRENELLAGTWHDLWQGAGVDVFRSLIGQGREALPSFDAFGCLCSLPARSALDGVSWVQSG
jgi:hypothetical protein